MNPEREESSQYPQQPQTTNQDHQLMQTIQFSSHQDNQYNAFQPPQQNYFQNNYFHQQYQFPLRTEIVNVAISFDDQTTQEYIPSLKVYPNTSFGMDLQSILQALREQSYPISDSKIFYKDFTHGYFVYAGYENQISKSFVLPNQGILSDNGLITIHLKIKYDQPNYQSHTNHQTSSSSKNQLTLSSLTDIRSEYEGISSSNILSDKEISTTAQDIIPDYDKISSEICYLAELPPSQLKRKPTTTNSASNTESIVFEETTSSQQYLPSLNNTNNAYFGSQNQQQFNKADSMQQLLIPAHRTKSQEMKQSVKRHKERTVREVIQLLNTWRSLSDEKNPNAISLAEAAARVGAPRKSLDDYMLMMKHGKAFGFNFEKNIDQKFGIVRAFVRKMKNRSKQIGSAPNLDTFDIEDGDSMRRYKSEDGTQKTEDEEMFGLDLSFSSRKITKYNY